MEQFYEQAVEKLSAAKVKGHKENIMAPFVAEALQNFCKQDEEFSQAVAQGGSFQDCMTAVAKGVGGSISDFDAYKKAVQFYFPGAEIRMEMTIDLVGAAKHHLTKEKKSEGIVLSLEEFL